MKISHFPVRFSRRMITVTAAAGAATVLGVTATVAVASGAPARAHGFSFRLVPSAGISSCLPHARGNVTITPQGENDKMVVHVAGLPKNSEFDLFVIQVPDKPFGVAWYQSDIDTGRNGTGSVTVRGIFDSETFSVSLGGTTTFGPTHQFHLGLWFNNPKQPFRLGCEPGATSPTVTPFNGEQHAGIQVLNTGQFPDNAGPLKHVHR
jgi:hypothetical protein